MSLQDLKTRALEIKTETVEDNNSANRVGGLLNDIIEFEETELNKRVSILPQTFNSTQKTQARTNIGAQEEIFEEMPGVDEMPIQSADIILFDDNDGTGTVTLEWYDEVPSPLLNFDKPFRIKRGQYIFTALPGEYLLDDAVFSIPLNELKYQEFQPLWFSGEGGEWEYSVVIGASEFDLFQLKNSAKLDQSSVHNLANSFSHIKGVMSFVNIDVIAPLETGYYSPYNARTVVPVQYQKKGLIIQYKISADITVTEKFIGTTWNVAHNYWRTEMQSYQQLIHYDDIVWYDGKYPYISNSILLQRKFVSNLSVIVKTRTGEKKLNASIIYPSVEVIGSSDEVTGFMISDYDGILFKGCNIGWIYVSYDVQEYREDANTIYSFTQNTLGNNVAISHDAGQNLHSVATKAAFDAVFPNFTGEVIRTDIDGLANARVSSRSRPLYSKIKGVDCYIQPYMGALELQNEGGNPEILSVAPFRDNTFQRADRNNVGEKFFPYSIAVGARVNDNNTQAGTSYGNGMEFFENTGNQNLNALYPEKTFLMARFVCTLNANPIILDLPEASGINVPLNALEFGIGTTVYVGQSGNMQEAVIVDRSANQIQLDRALNALPAGTNYIYNNVHIGTLWQPRIFLDYPTNLQLTDIFSQQQSCAAPIVGAKFKKIQAATGANWNMIREAARKTASNANAWDIYRGYGIVDVGAAIQYIKDTYTENEDYIAGEADKYNGTRKVNKVIRLQDISDDCPVAKRHLRDAIIEILNELNIS